MRRKRRKRRNKKSHNSDSSDSENRRRVSEVKLLPFPKIGQLPALQAALRTACADAAYVLDESEIIVWLKQAELDTTTFEDLRHSGKRFIQLDRRLAHALKKICQASKEATELMRAITTKSQNENGDNFLIKGRQI